MHTRLNNVALMAVLALSTGSTVLATPRASDPPPAPAEQSTTQPQTPGDQTPPNQSDDESREHPEDGLLTPITANGGLPKIYNKLYDLTEEQLRHRAIARDYTKQIRLIRHKHFGDVKAPAVRAAGTEQLKEFTDPASFKPLIEELKGEKDDVKLALLDHFATRGEEGQAALGWVAIFDADAAIRNEALNRMVSPVADPVLYLLNGALRSKKAEVANAAASLASSLNVVQAIPLLIFAQAAGQTNDGQQQGDLAWIAIQTQRAYVQGLNPVVGDASGGFEPVIGIVSEGVVMRVMDAYVIEYRTPVHLALVNLATQDWGQPTANMGYNIQSWWDWYNDEYVPYKREKAREAELSKTPANP
jgi:hypothetical protein